jgi:SAM-dependent methyltransferase
MTSDTDSPATAGIPIADRATSFGAAAGEYDRYRVGPPAEVVDRVLPGGVQAVLDLGAGTGAMTRRLVGRAARVYAVDPDPRMTELLARSCPGVEVSTGTAEHIPLPSDCVDAVVVASAWHWVEPVAAIPEIARILRPGGTLCIVWNRRDRTVPWVAELEAKRLEVTGGDDWVEERIQYFLQQPWLPEDSPFGKVEIESQGWQAAMSKEATSPLRRSASPPCCAPSPSTSRTTSASSPSTTTPAPARSSGSRWCATPGGAPWSDRTRAEPRHASAAPPLPQFAVAEAAACTNESV